MCFRKKAKANKKEEDYFEKLLKSQGGEEINSFLDMFSQEQKALDGVEKAMDRTVKSGMNKKSQVDDFDDIFSASFGRINKNGKDK